MVEVDLFSRSMVRSTFVLLKVDISSLVTVGNSLNIFSLVVVGISFVKN